MLRSHNVKLRRTTTYLTSTNYNPGASSKSSTNNGTKTTTLSPCDPTIKNCGEAGSAPPVDCSANPTNPACQQRPPTTTTKSCPDRSQPDASGKCPTVHQQQQSNPSSSGQLLM